MRVLITGGCGFVGTAVTDRLLRRGIRVLNLDKMTPAASPEALADWEGTARYEVMVGDCSDLDLVLGIFEEFQPDRVIHCAAETAAPDTRASAARFMQTNFVGTFTMLEAARHFWSGRRGDYRFHQISTDEVFGPPNGVASAPEEGSAFAPTTPFAASKAAACHLVNAWGQTYNLAVVTTTCTNGYGPWQYPLQPLPNVITRGIEQRNLTLTEEAHDVRDWVHVEDQAAGVCRVLEHGRTGESYNLGGRAAHSGAEVMQMICRELDDRLPDHAPHARMIEMQVDEPQARNGLTLDTTKIWRDLRWQPEIDLRSGLSRTVDWYLANRAWWEKRTRDTRHGHVPRREAA